MVQITTLAFFFSSTVALVAASSHLPLHARHITPRSMRKRCKVKGAAPAPAPPATPAPSNTSNGGNNNNNNNNNGGGGGGGAFLSVASDCGDIGANPDQPNGSQEWLNCNLGSGWRPQNVKISDLVYEKDLRAAIGKPGSPFGPCSGMVDKFEQIGGETGVPAILLASIAMQESTCNPNAVGGGGEQGLMQITQDKCGAAPGGNCRDPDFNLRTGAQYFKSQLDAHGGNFLATMGSYNGWFPGMTEGAARAAAYGDCCRCQQNLDYLYQMCNGWLQNKDGYSMGSIKNLAVCH